MVSDSSSARMPNWISSDSDVDSRRVSRVRMSAESLQSWCACRRAASFRGRDVDRCRVGMCFTTAHSVADDDLIAADESSFHTYITKSIKNNSIRLKSKVNSSKKVWAGRPFAKKSAIHGQGRDRTPAKWPTRGWGWPVAVVNSCACEPAVCGSERLTL